MSTGNQTMRLVGARVTNYGCFRDSGEVPIDTVTVLLAENENGKSTFLRALSWWSSGEPFDEEDRWADADADATLDLVALTFEASGPAEAVLKAAGSQLPERVRVIRDSSNAYRVEEPSASRILEVPDTSESARDPSALDAAKAAVIESLNTQAIAIGTVPTFVAELDAAVPGGGAFDGIVARMRAELIPVVPAEAQPQLAEQVNTLLAEARAFEEPPSPQSVHDLLKPYLPVLIYFDETVDYVQDAVTYAEITADATRHRTMINLATVAGIDLLNVASLGPHQRQAASRTVERTLSTAFSKYWQGDPVTVFAQVDESQMTITIEHKGRTQRPSRRSSGLKWQLGFFVNFRAEVKDALSGAVLLLDEPGLHLHIKQQPKLLELFDDLARDGCRIIYTTHLSHMLPPDKPNIFRPLVADPTTPNATTVIANIASMPSKSDVMQPVRQALGMGIADAIGLGGVNVIAEGWAERYVLLAMSDLCRASGRAALDPYTTVLPAGGSGKKMVPMAATAVAEKTKAAVLVDDDRAGRTTEKVLSETLPGAVAIVRTHQADERTDRELEDLFAPAMYLELVNMAHADVDGYKPIDVADIDAAQPICDAIAARFKASKLGGFQKLRPAMELQKWVDLENVPDGVTLDQFSSLFERLASALASP